MANISELEQKGRNGVGRKGLWEAREGKENGDGEEREDRMGSGGRQKGLFEHLCMSQELQRFAYIKLHE